MQKQRCGSMFCLILKSYYTLGWPNLTLYDIQSRDDTEQSSNLEVDDVKNYMTIV